MRHLLQAVVESVLPVPHLCHVHHPALERREEGGGEREREREREKERKREREKEINGETWSY